MTLVETLIPRDAVRVVGEDAATFLQGQISQDVAGLGVGESTWSLVLQPQGKVDAWFGLTRTGDHEFVLDVDTGYGEALLARLERFKLRVKVEQSLVDGVRLLAVRGPGVSVPEGLSSRPAVAPGSEGVDELLLPETDSPDVVSSPEVYESMRIEHGVPAMGREITEKTIPAELGQWLIDASVSFTKGCFTGQELVARIDSRGGNVPRHLRVITVDGADQPPVGAALSVDGAAAGTLTSVAPATDGPGFVALAFVPRSIEGAADADLTWDTGDATAHIRLGA